MPRAYIMCAEGSNMKNNAKTDTPFWDPSLPFEERLDWLLSEMTMDEKLSCMATRVPDLERLGIPGFSVGGEAAHGVEARNDQNDLGAAEPTTSFPQPIGMSATWDPDLIKKAGEVTGGTGYLSPSSRSRAEQVGAYR